MSKAAVRTGKKSRVERISVDKISVYVWPKCKVKLAVRWENTEKYIKTLIKTGIHHAKTVDNKTVLKVKKALHFFFGLKLDVITRSNIF